MPANNFQFDFRDLKCPMLLVRAKQCLKNGQQGDCYRFVVNDRNFAPDLSKLAKKHGFELRIENEQKDHWDVIVRLHQTLVF